MENTKTILNEATVSGSTAKTKTFSDWTRKELEALPSREWNQDINEFDSLIILPMNEMHDSDRACCQCRN